jgi:hypothetical protein
VFFIIVGFVKLARHSGMRRKAQTRNPEVVARDSGFALTRAPE